MHDDGSAPTIRTGAPGGPRTRERAGHRPFDATVTDIIPFNEFGDLDDFADERDACRGSAFDREARVISAPELDDLHDTDDLTPLQLTVPAEFRRAAGDSAPTAHAYRDSRTDITDGTAVTDVIHIGARRGSHRKVEHSAIRARLVAAAMAAGATAAAAYSMVHHGDSVSGGPVLAAAHTAAAVSPADGVQVVSVTPVLDASVHNQELAKGAAFAQERAEREARLSRPLFVMPTNGVWTSGFGYRWGALHGGIDLANSIGTPIVAASDGVVIDAGPTAGYGAWVKLRHSDGTVTLYGHVNTWLVSVGQRVMAGDQIATIGNRGNSTGPHLHFEVLLNGTDRVDPVPWLAKRGLSPGRYVG